MRVLVTWGSKMGGTAGIATMLAERLREDGLEVLARPADDAPSPHGFDAVIVGGALYANHWHKDARRFVDDYERELRQVPTWLFSSGPLDDSVRTEDLPPPRQVRALMDRIGALGHVTFGGRLDPATATGMAAAMAKTNAGDWRDPERIRAWADQLAYELPTATPSTAITPPGRSPVRVVEYGVVGWALPAATLVAFATTVSVTFAVVLHAIVAPVWFAVMAHRYQSLTGARAPLPIALLWTAMFGVLHATLVAGALRTTFVVVDSVSAFWLPIALVLVASWATGAISSMLPFPKRTAPPTPAAAPSR